jgi:O-antigen/teichoic acid export membrane protein
MQPPGEIAASSHRRALPAGAFLNRYRYAVAAADQVAISLLNFGITFSLLRILSATEFGIVALWMAAANLAIGVHNALVCGPLGIQAPAEADETKRHRLREALASANLLVVMLAVLAVLVVNGASDAEWTPKDFLTGAAIPLFIGAGLYREYYRSIAFGRHDMMLLLVVDAPYLATTAACIAAMLLWPQHLAGVAGAFIALALGGAAALLCGSWRLPRHRARPFRRGWSATYRSISSDVSWALTGVVFAHVQERSYVYITTRLVGLAQVASLNAVAFLFRPGQILLTAWRRSSLPELAALFAAGAVGALDRRLVAALAAALSGWAAWCAALWFGWRLIEHYLLAGKYPEAFLLLLPWAIAIALDTMDFVLSTALLAAREFRFLACVTLITAPITAVATAGLIFWHGYTWAIYGLAIGNGLSVAMVAARLRKVRQRLIARTPARSGGAAAGPVIG